MGILTSVPIGLVLAAGCGAGGAARGGPTPPGSGSGGGAPPRAPASEDVTIETDGRATVLGLAIEVVQNLEKLDEDGRTVMRVELRVRDARGEEGEVHLSTERLEATWQGWRFHYLGGWRAYVQLRVTAPGA